MISAVGSLCCGAEDLRSESPIVKLLILDLKDEKQKETLVQHDTKQANLGNALGGTRKL